MLPKAPTTGKKILRTSNGYGINFPFTQSDCKIFSHTRSNVDDDTWCCSTAMLITGFGMQQSLNKMVPVQYGEITHYQLLGVFNNKAKNADDYGKKVSSDKNISDYKSAYFENITVAVPNIQDLQSVPMIVADNDNLARFISLKSKNNQRIVSPLVANWLRYKILWLVIILLLRMRNKISTKLGLLTLPKIILVMPSICRIRIIQKYLIKSIVPMHTLLS